MDRKTEILKEFWGFDSFRPLQDEIIDSVLNGKDTLALMPTGGGKSLCFQVPALVEDGVCLVISPLIALMKDQVKNLRKRGIKADAVFSGMHYKEIDRIIDNAVYGDTKLLYVSPERLQTDILKERIKKMNVSLLAIDEAHCVSQWGYDFRPAYLNIPEFRKLIPYTPLLALTATATPDVVDDIQEKLAFKPEAGIFQKSFGRSNLSYSVFQEENKRVKLFDILSKVKGSGVVYAGTRRKTKDIAVYLYRKGISAEFYHAGLTPDQRSKKQDDWISGKIRIMVATNAFGMGIDKPDVRVVVHMDLPNNLEAYFQEAGRGGRDGKKSYSVLLYSPKDKSTLEKQYEQSFPESGEIKRVWQALGSKYQLAIGAGKGDSFDFDLIPFCETYSLDIVKTHSALKILEQDGWLTLSEAVHLPPTVKFIVEKEALYDYQLKNKKLDKPIRRILQTYQGGYNRLIPLKNMGRLAGSLKWSQEHLIKALEILHRDEIIEFRPAKDKPQITFLRERRGANDLQLNKERYDFRKERHFFRMNKAISYAETPICRSKQLLAYFGETESDACGICDVCTGRNQSEFKGDEFERLKTKILRLLKRENLNTEEILEAFAPKWEVKLLKVIQYLYEEGILLMDKEDKFSLGKE